MNSESNQYLKKHDLFIIYNEALNRIKESGKKVVISNLACQAGFIYSPKLYYIPVRVDHYYLNFLFWTYAEPFRNKNKKIFKRQSSLLSNIEDISKNESIIFISNDDFMKFLESYLYLFYQKKLVYQKQHIENIDCLFEYKISINQLPVN
jgi:hypothetical protein